MIRPRPSINKKVIISVVTAILVVAAIVFASFSAFGGNPTPSQPEEPVINNPAETPTAQPPQPTTPIFDDEPESMTEMAEEKSNSVEGEQGVEPHPEGGDPTTSEQPEVATPEGGNETESTVSPTENEGETDTQLVPPVAAQSSLSVEKIWSGIRGCMGETPTVNMSLSAANLQELYGFDPSICQSFVAIKSGTIASPEEFLIAKATESNLSIIEQSCQQRQQALIQQWGNIGNYADILNAYQIVRSGEYLFFGISPNIAQLVGIFQGMMLAT